jgi:hypothetical protein
MRGNTQAPAGVYETTDSEARTREMSDYFLINLISLGLLGALGLRRLVRMERFHRTRVVLLTALLWVPTIFLVLLFVPPVGAPSCGPSLDGPGSHFRIDE